MQQERRDDVFDFGMQMDNLSTPTSRAKGPGIITPIPRRFHAADQVCADAFTSKTDCAQQPLTSSVIL